MLYKESANASIKQFKEQAKPQNETSLTRLQKMLGVISPYERYMVKLRLTFVLMSYRDADRNGWVAEIVAIFEFKSILAC